MNQPVSLRQLADELESLPEGAQAWLHRKTGELILATEEECRLAEDDEGDDDDSPESHRAAVTEVHKAMGSEEWLPLPDRFDFDEYRMMRDFAATRDDDRLRDELLDSIQGSGAFRRFRDAVHRRGVQDDWYSHKAGCYARVVAERLDAEGIAYGE